MKISLIPRVLINKSPKNEQSDDLMENDPKKETMIPLPEKEKKNKVKIYNKKKLYKFSNIFL